MTLFHHSDTAQREQLAAELTEQFGVAPLFVFPEDYPAYRAGDIEIPDGGVVVSYPHDFATLTVPLGRKQYEVAADLVRSIRERRLFVDGFEEVSSETILRTVIWTALNDWLAEVDIASPVLSCSHQRVVIPAIDGDLLRWCDACGVPLKLSEVPVGSAVVAEFDDIGCEPMDTEAVAAAPQAAE